MRIQMLNGGVSGGSLTFAPSARIISIAYAAFRRLVVRMLCRVRRCGLGRPSSSSPASARGAIAAESGRPLPAPVFSELLLRRLQRDNGANYHMQLLYRGQPE